MGRAFEDLEGLCPRVVDPRRRPDHLPQGSARDLFFGEDIGTGVSFCVADKEIPTLLLGCRHDFIRILEAKRNRLFHKNGLAELQGLKDRKGMLVLGGGDDDRVHFRSGDHLKIISREKIGIHLLAHSSGTRGVDIRNGQETDRRMGGRDVGPLRSHTTNADDRNTEILADNPFLPTLFHHCQLLYTNHDLCAIWKSCSGTPCGKVSPHALEIFRGPLPPQRSARKDDCLSAKREFRLCSEARRCRVEKCPARGGSEISKAHKSPALFALLQRLFPGGLRRSYPSIDIPDQ